MHQECGVPRLRGHDPMLDPQNPVRKSEDILFDIPGNNDDRLQNRRDKCRYRGSLGFFVLQDVIRGR